MIEVYKPNVDSDKWVISFTPTEGVVVHNEALDDPLYDNIGVYNRLIHLNQDGLIRLTQTLLRTVMQIAVPQVTDDEWTKFKARIKIPTVVYDYLKVIAPPGADMDLFISAILCTFVARKTDDERVTEAVNPDKEVQPWTSILPEDPR